MEFEPFQQALAADAFACPPGLKQDVIRQHDTLVPIDLQHRHDVLIVGLLTERRIGQHHIEAGPGITCQGVSLPRWACPPFTLAQTVEK